MTDAAPEPILLKPGDDPKIIAHLPDELRAIPPGMRREVRISATTYSHIISRRTDEAEWHAELVTLRMVGVIKAPTHIGRLSTRPNRVEL